MFLKTPPKFRIMDDYQEVNDYEEYIPLKQRKSVAELARRKRARVPETEDAVFNNTLSKSEQEKEGEVVEPAIKREQPVSLLDQVRHAQDAAVADGRGLQASESDAQKALEEDLLKQVMSIQKNALNSASEVATGLKFTESIKTDWRPLRRVRALTAADQIALRAKWHILVEGEDVPPPCGSFEDMRLPMPIIEALSAKGIKRPTPIQTQGLPVAFSGRDMIGIAFTGSGKSLAFCLPLLMLALQEEVRLPLIRGEGPIGIILAPSRELARQHADTLQHFATYLSKSGQYPALRIMVSIGGEDMKTQLESVQRGVHMVVATPGRLFDHLTKRRITLDLCRYIVLDEGDRMLDMGFGEDIKKIISFFNHQRQTVIYSATMPKSIEDFARESLVRPVIVNVSRAGAANLDVLQEVEYVKHEAKVVYLLHVLQKTSPPVLIFAENKRDVDEIHEYLLLKGVSAVSVHGDKSQDERNESIRAYKDSKKDVLVATDVAAKGLDFPDVQHVINFDMPKDIETYVHRIGRTGRAGKTGIATTFINKSVDERLLLDLKHLLREAKQAIPQELSSLEDPSDHVPSFLHSSQSQTSSGQTDTGGGGCTYCGGLGHRITECPRLEREKKKLSGVTRDSLGSKGGDW
jgi:ATP-dependent RNA helicase DDX41